MKLLKLRIQFRENTRPLAEESSLEKSVLNQFKVPFRLSPQQDEKEGMIILLRGDNNANAETGEWHGTHGFVARFLNKPVMSEGQLNSTGGLSRGNRKTKLEVHEIDVNQWQEISEIDKIAKLSELM